VVPASFRLVITSQLLLRIRCRARVSTLFFDQLGCGRSDRPGADEQEYSIRAFVCYLAEVIEALVASGLIPSRDGRPAQWREQALAALRCEGPLVKPLIWNAGFYLWRQGSQPTLAAGLGRAEELLRSGSVGKLQQSLTSTNP